MNISNKFINNCNDFDINKVKVAANKLGLSTTKSKKMMCSDIHKKYEKQNPCNLVIDEDTDMSVKNYQINVSNHMFKNRGGIVVHSVGTGKTITAVATAQCLLISNVIEHVIVITPTSLKHNFINQAKKYGLSDEDIESHYTFYTIQGIINSIESKRAINPKNSLIIIDEAHNLRKVDSVRFGYIFKYAKKATKVMLLTATPLINFTYDIVNLVSLISGEKPITCNKFSEVIESKKSLSQYIGNIFLFYMRSNSNNVNFPNKKINEVYLPMNKKYSDIYDRIERGHVSKFKNFKGKNVHVFYNGLRRASNTIEDISPKVDWIVNFIKTHKNKKIVIFSHFIEMGIMPITKYLNKHNIPFSHIIGDVSTDERNIAVEKYNNDDVKIMFISKAGSEGLDLKNTSSIIIMEPSWNENTIEQIIGRGVRYKSHAANKTVNIYKLYTIKSFENKNIKEILNKNMLSFDGFMLSVDLYLRNYSIIKQKKLDLFNNVLIKLSK
jgi:superfamily II DNA or RNA helicase